MLSEKEIKLILKELENRLLKKERKQNLSLTLDWRKTIPSKPGIYAIFENDQLVYVGESGNIRGRMNDLRDSRHHQVRRNIGEIKFSKIKGYKAANSKTKFPPHIEERIDRFIKEKCSVSILPLAFGRKELEEHIYEKYQLNSKFNKKGRRKAN